MNNKKSSQTNWELTEIRSDNLLDNKIYLLSKIKYNFKEWEQLIPSVKWRL